MWNEQFETLLRTHLPFLPDDEELRPDLDLRESGLDSFGVIDLLVLLESEFHIHMTDDILSVGAFGTPGTLWETLIRAQSAGIGDIQNDAAGN
jgi:acyl carrier protein